jgi:hypothetical protein
MEGERGEPQRFKFPCQHIGVTVTLALTCRPIMSRHYAGMTQDGLRIADLYRQETLDLAA